MSKPMQPYDAVILILEQMRPGGVLEGFKLVSVRPGVLGHMVDMVDTNDPFETWHSVNTDEHVMPDVDWNQSPARLMTVLAALRY